MTDTARYGAPTRPRGSVADWTLVILTWASVVTNGWLLFLPPRHHDLHHGVLVADLVICVLLALAICWRWLRFRAGRRLLRKQWWEVIALFPFIVPTVGEWKAVLLAVLVARLVRTVDRTDNVLGDRVTADLVRHFSDPIVTAIKRPITIAVLDEVVDVIRAGTYAANVRSALDENRAELEQLVLELVRNDQATGKLRRLPFHDDLVTMIADTVLRLVNGALDDPRTTELISDVIAHSADQLRVAVRQPRPA
ncbi:ion transporter [Nocardioides ultimimeridianus]